jgi:hypothetical protein
VWRLTLLHTPVRSAHEMERGQRGVARQISSRLCACLTVEKPGALCAVTEENLALAPRHRAVSPCMIMQSRIRRAQHEATRRGRIFPMEEDHQAQATLKRLVPHHGGRQMPMRVLWPRAAVLETVQGLAGDLPILLTPCPTSLRVRTGGEKHAVSVAPPWGEGMPREADAFLTLFLLRIVTVSTGLGDTRRQAMPRLAQWLRVEGDPGFFRLSLGGGLARRRLRPGASASAPACDLHHRAGGNLPPACGTTRAAMEAVPATARRRITLGEAGRIMRREPCRVRAQRRHEHTRRKGGPGTGRPTLPCDGTGSLGAVATQGAEVDATASHKDRDAQGGQELPRGWPESGPLSQAVVDHGHKPCTGSRGSGMRSPHVPSLWPHLFTPFAQKMSEVLRL